MNTRKKIIVIAGIFLLLVIFLSIQIPYTIKAPCHILPKSEWSLLKADPDKLESSLLDNRDGKMTSFSLLQFDREDFVQFRMKSGLRDNQSVRAGDTIAVLSSSNNQMLLADLKGELRKAEASLSMALSGEKPALQEEAYQALQLAEVQLESFEPQYLRRRELFEEGLVSEEEWEITRATYNMYKRNVAMAEARLESLQSGEKKEMIRFLQRDIERLREQIRLQTDKLQQGIILAPVSGVLTFSGTDSLICKVDQTDTLLIRLAIPPGELKRAQPGQEISVSITETGQNYRALLSSIHKRSYIITGRLHYIITGRIEDEAIDLMPGMTGYAEIRAGSASVFSRLVSAFSSQAGFNFL